MTPSAALRHLLAILHAMDLENQQLRPTEKQYQQAVAQAEAALAAEAAGLCSVCGRGPHAIDDPECRPRDERDLQLVGGGRVDLRAPWATPRGLDA